MTAPTQPAAYHAAREAYMSVRRIVSTMLLDRPLGIETSRAVELDTFGLGTEDRVSYEPSGMLALRRMLDRHPLEPDDVFLDLGCGKGRAVLLAARRPFRRAIGVEVSPQLTDVARRNLDACRPRLRCQDVSFVTADAASYEVPDDVTFVYLCNPFRGATFQAAVEALVASVDRRPRRLHVSYYMPLEHDRLMATGRFRHVRTVSSWRPTREWSRRAGMFEYEALS